MTGRALIAHGGPQRYPTRAAPSLMRALRDARGSPPWTPWTILCRLTGTTGLMQPLLVSTVQIAATLSPTPSAASSRDHDHRNPHLAKEREPACRVGVGERRQEQPPEQARQHPHRQEKAGLAAHPARPVERYPATRHNHMNMGMVAPTPTIP